MIKTASTTTSATTIGAIKKFATAAAMMGALGMGALGAAGAAAAAPGAHHAPSNTSASSENAGPKNGDDVVHAHFIPGFKPVPPAASEVPAPTLGFPPSPDRVPSNCPVCG